MDEILTGKLTCKAIEIVLTYLQLAYQSMVVHKLFIHRYSQSETYPTRVIAFSVPSDLCNRFENFLFLIHYFSAARSKCMLDM